MVRLRLKGRESIGESEKETRRKSSSFSRPEQTTKSGKICSATLGQHQEESCGGTGEGGEGGGVDCVTTLQDKQDTIGQHQEESCGGTGEGGGRGGGDCVTAWQDKQDTKKVFYSKVRSLQCKINELSCILCDLKPDIVILTETWCNESISSAILQIPGFNIEESLRIDRTDTVNGIGGGIIEQLFYYSSCCLCLN